MIACSVNSAVLHFRYFLERGDAVAKASKDTHVVSQDRPIPPRLNPVLTWRLGSCWGVMVFNPFPLP